MTSGIRHLAGIAAALVTLWLTADPALACACCSNRASRHVAVEKLGESRLVEIGNMVFAEDAFVADGGADHPIDIEAFGPALKLGVTQTTTGMVFALRGAAGRTAALTLAIPDSISIFEVDPRGGTEDTGLGPVLYKEWQLSANASGTGIFQPIVGAGQRLTLVLHGRGRGCTEASHFTDWTLLIQGPAGNLTLYGALGAR